MRVFKFGKKSKKGGSKNLKGEAPGTVQQSPKQPYVHVIRHAQRDSMNIGAAAIPQEVREQMQEQQRRRRESNPYRSLTNPSYEARRSMYQLAGSYASPKTTSPSTSRHSTQIAIDYEKIINGAHFALPGSFDVPPLPRIPSNLSVSSSSNVTGSSSSDISIASVMDQAETLPPSPYRYGGNRKAQLVNMRRGSFQNPSRPNILPSYSSSSGSTIKPTAEEGSSTAAAASLASNRQYWSHSTSAIVVSHLRKSPLSIAETCEELEQNTFNSSRHSTQSTVTNSSISQSPEPSFEMITNNTAPSEAKNFSEKIMDTPAKNKKKRWSTFGKRMD